VETAAAAGAVTPRLNFSSLAFPPRNSSSSRLHDAATAATQVKRYELHGMGLRTGRLINFK
jgi:hypothetical protein